MIFHSYLELPEGKCEVQHCPIWGGSTIPERAGVCFCKENHLLPLATRSRNRASNFFKYPMAATETIEVLLGKGGQVKFIQESSRIILRIWIIHHHPSSHQKIMQNGSSRWRNTHLIRPCRLPSGSPAPLEPTRCCECNQRRLKISGDLYPQAG